MALTSKIVLSIVSELTAAQDLTTARAPHSIKKAISLATGVAADQADLIFSDTRNVLAGADDDLDLTALDYDPLGLQMAFVKVKMLYLFAHATNGDYIQVGGAAATQFVDWVGAVDDIVQICPGGMLLLVNPTLAGYAVAGGTKDLGITNADGAAAADYDIVIIGTSA